MTEFIIEKTISAITNKLAQVAKTNRLAQGPKTIKVAQLAKQTA